MPTSAAEHEHALRTLLDECARQSDELCLERQLERLDAAAEGRALLLDELPLAETESAAWDALRAAGRTVRGLNCSTSELYDRLGDWIVLVARGVTDPAHVSQ
jgi:hypothetical protein